MWLLGEISSICCSNEIAIVSNDLSGYQAARRCILCFIAFYHEHILLSPLGYYLISAAAFLLVENLRSFYAAPAHRTNVPKNAHYVQGHYLYALFIAPCKNLNAHCTLNFPVIHELLCILTSSQLLTPVSTPTPRPLIS